MDDKDLDKLAERFLLKCEARRKTFWVEPEGHYNDHRRLTSILEAFDRASSQIGKGLIWLVFLGFVALALIGIKFNWGPK